MLIISSDPLLGKLSDLISSHCPLITSASATLASLQFPDYQACSYFRAFFFCLRCLLSETLTLQLSPWPTLIPSILCSKLLTEIPVLLPLYNLVFAQLCSHHHKLITTASALTPPSLHHSVSSLPYFMFSIALIVISLLICLLTIFPP